MSQKTCNEKVLTRCKMLNVKPIDTPYATNFHPTRYDKLFYCLYKARSCTCSKCGEQVYGSAKKGAMDSCKEDSQYLKGKSDVGIVNGGENSDLVTCNFNSDYVGDRDNMKSMIGFVFT